MKKFFRQSLAFGFILFAAASCSNNAQQEKTTDEFADTAATEVDSVKAKEREKLEFKFFFTIANLPSPMEMINAIYENNIPFNKDLLNSSSRASDYTTAYKKAVNYGIYGIDMSYTAFYGQNQDLLDYYSTTKKMAEKLGVQETFDKFTTSFRENSNNRDSLVKIIDRAYTETDSYLRSNRRLEVASHVLAGSIVEVQFLSIELLKNMERTAANADLYERVYNQKLYLQNLIGLFSDLKKYPSSAQLLEQLKGVQKVFDTVKSPEELTKDNLNKMAAAIGAVRADMIK
jgi:dihydroorotate dehydrogenase